jgi:hypothetical protein
LPSGESDEDVEQAAGLMATYSKSASGFAVQVVEKKEDSVSEWMASAVPLSRAVASQWRIGLKQGTSAEAEEPSDGKEA